MYEALKNLRPATRARKAKLSGRTADYIFTEIYVTNGWQSPESKSGGGSTLSATAAIRAALPRLLSDLGVAVLIDAPCGDFNWMRHVDLPVQTYIGGEIVPGLVKRADRRFQNDQRRFMLLDLTRDRCRLPMRCSAGICSFICRTPTSSG